MRILIVQESDWVEVGPHDSHHLLERLSKQGDQILVIDYHVRWKKNEGSLLSHRTEKKNFHKTIPDGNVTVVTPWFIRAPILDYLSLLLSHFIEIKRQIDSFKPDIIIGLGIINTNIAMRLAKRYHIPFVHYVIDELHQLVPDEFMKGLAKLIERRNLQEADLVISTNQGLRDYCIGMGASQESTTIIKHGVDLSRYYSADGNRIRAELGLKDDDVVLFFMGWLYNFSGLDTVANMIVKSEDPHLKLLIVGNGELWDDLQRIKGEDAIGGRIIMVDWKPYPEIPEYIAASDICILPSQYNQIMENIVPIKIIEYMAAKKPVIATSLPGLVREFGLDSGIVFINEPDETISAAYSLSNKGKQLEYGKIAQNAVKRNGWDVLVPEFQLKLTDLIKSKRSTSIILVGSDDLLVS